MIRMRIIIELRWNDEGEKRQKRKKGEKKDFGSLIKSSLIIHFFVLFCASPSLLRSHVHLFPVDLE